MAKERRPNSTILGERHSTMRPHLLNGSNYSYWRTRMKLFIQANDYEVWRIITNGSFIPMKRDNNDIKKIKLNAKVMHILFCALDANENNKVSLCNNAKEIWDKLEVTHEGTTSWEAKVTVIEESKHLNSLSLNELISSLLTYKMRLNKRSGEERIMKKNVGKALKSTTNDDSESNEEVVKDKEIEMLARRFMRFMRSNKEREFQKKEGIKLQSTKEKDPIIFYKCKKSGHIKYDCPQLKKKGSSKQKAYVAT
ncbi:hypothetical protein V6Z12_D02G148400 [Gossypium hirsutum]